MFAIAIIALYFILPVSIPLIAGLITALALNPLVKLLQRRARLSRQHAVLIVFLLFLFLVGTAGTYIIITTLTQIVHLIDDMPKYINDLNVIYGKLEEELQQYAQNLPPEFVRQVTSGLQDNLTTIGNAAKDKLTLDNIAQLFVKVPQYLISILVYLIALFLFMLELPIIKARIYAMLTEETAAKVTFMNKRLGSVVLGFIKAQVLVSFFILGASLIGLFLIVPEVAFIMSLIIWIIDIIPIIGSIIILGPWFIFTFLSGDTVLGTKLAILAVILLAIRRILEPKFMGQHIGLSPLATLVSMFIGLKLLGIFGFILGPLLVIAFKSAKEAGIIKWNVKV
ncbi:sporulation integral membrane protein YtvI [Aciduricibacillus chroicocephali]